MLIIAFCNDETPLQIILPLVINQIFIMVKLIVMFNKISIAYSSKNSFFIFTFKFALKLIAEILNLIIITGLIMINYYFLIINNSSLDQNSIDQVYVSLNGLSSSICIVIIIFFGLYMIIELIKYFELFFNPCRKSPLVP